MRRWVWLPCVLVLLGAGHFGYWHIVSARLRDGYEAWAASARAEGWTINSGKPEVGGWPFAATLTLPEMFIGSTRLAPPDGSAGDMTWSTDGLALRVGLLDPQLLEISSTGLQRLRLGDGTEIPYTADEVLLDIPLDPAGAGFADLVAHDVRLGLPVGGEPGAKPDAQADTDAIAGLTVGLLKGHLDLQRAAAGSAPTFPFLLAAEAIGLPPRAMPAVAAALGSRLSSLSIEGSLRGPLPLPGDAAAQARAWRDGGGSFELARLAMGWGPLGLSLTGSFTLDQDLQPAGAGTAHIIGFARSLDALAASHAIGAHAALAVKALLGLIAAPEGQADAVDLPLELQDRTLMVRHVPLLRLPALEWD